jgi:hypothetical protein
MVSNPEQTEHWSRMAHIYLALSSICAITVFAIAVVLYRRRKSSSLAGTANRAP